MRASDATVKTHVSNVLTELVLPDRVQAAIVAYASGVLGSSQCRCRALKRPTGRSAAPG